MKHNSNIMALYIIHVVAHTSMSDTFVPAGPKPSSFPDFFTTLQGFVR